MVLLSPILGLSKRAQQNLNNLTISHMHNYEQGGITPGIMNDMV